jgi:hypothetical protein
MPPGKGASPPSLDKCGEVVKIVTTIFTNKQSNKMHTIKVSDVVWSAIAGRGKFGETEDDVLRRVFDLAPKPETERPISSGRQGRGNRRYATKRMSARTENGLLVVEFTENGPAESWKLPDRSNKRAIRLIREEAVAFALEHGASDPGQTNAVRKALTDAGYHISK